MCENCKFCLENGLLQDASLYQNGAFFVLAMRQDDRKHAVMVIPKRHVETPFDMAEGDWAGMSDALAFAKDHLAGFAPDGYSIGWNVGAAGGQHVMHAHLHVICRFDGDAAAGMGINALIKAQIGTA